MCSYSNHCIVHVLKSLYSTCVRTQITKDQCTFTKCMHRKKHKQLKFQSNYTWILKFLVQFDILTLECIDHIFRCLFYSYTFAHLRWTIPGPTSWYISWVIHCCWKVDRDPKIEPPIQDKNLRSGGASIFTLMGLGTKARNSSSSLSANPVKVEKYDTENSITCLKLWLICSATVNIGGNNRIIQ